LTKKIPEDFKSRLLKNGVNTASGVFNRYEGDQLTVYCVVDAPNNEGGLTRGGLKYKSCRVLETEKWGKGWTDPAQTGAEKK